MELVKLEPQPAASHLDQNAVITLKKLIERIDISRLGALDQKPGLLIANHAGQFAYDGAMLTVAMARHPSLQDAGGAGDPAWGLVTVIATHHLRTEAQELRAELLQGTIDDAVPLASTVCGSGMLSTWANTC